MRSASTPPATCGSRTSRAARATGPDSGHRRPSRCGICGTDLHEYIAGPIVHAVRAASADRCAEPADSRARVRGEVVAVGRGRDRAPRSAIASRSCRSSTAAAATTAVAACSTSAHDGAASGSRADWGGMAELANRRGVSGRSAFPEGVTYEQGALIEPTAVAAYGVRAGRRRPGDSVLVTGAGPIGALAALCAARGGSVDRLRTRSRTRRVAREPRRSAWRRFSTRRLQTSRRSSVSATDGLGVDVAIECSGHPSEPSGRASRRSSAAARWCRSGCSCAPARSTRCSGRSTT